MNLRIQNLKIKNYATNMADQTLNYNYKLG